jgi:hypothetical protein
MRDYIWGGGETISPVLKVPRQCPLVLLIEVNHMIGINFLIWRWEGCIKQKFLCYQWEGYMWRKKCNVEFRYQLVICSRAEENQGNPWSICPVAGPSGCKVTSSQLSGIKYGNPNVSPYLAVALFGKSLHTNEDRLNNRQTDEGTITGTNSAEE